MNYYNEFKPEAAQILRELIIEGIIPAGDVDERSITDVKNSEIRGYTQHHFFAGIGGWPIAFRLAGWPPTRPVWSGSCPCQPYSQVGRGQGFEDERDLWPVWFGLRQEFQDVIIFGEQVADAIEYGWLDRIIDDMATQNNTVWPVVLPACAAGGWHERERIFFVGHPDSPRLEGHGRYERALLEGSMEDGYFAAPGICDGSFVKCWDGLKRLVKPGIPLLDDGISGGLAKVYAEGFGNAIDPRIAAQFIKSTM